MGTATRLRRSVGQTCAVTCPLPASVWQGGGGSDYIFCDGSARFLRAGESVLPLNRWAVTPAWRNIGVPTAPSGG